MAQVNATTGRNGFSTEITLDALFRRNAMMRGDFPALIDSGGKRYSFAQARAAADSIAAQIAALGLPPNSSIILLLPNGAELALTLLATLRAGHIPVPVPIAWRKSDLVRACREAEAGALITTAHYSAENLPQLAVDVALEAFELSFPCAFGAPLPDGITPLFLSPDAAGPADLQGIQPASGIGTLQTEAGGVSFVLHRDEEMIAAGLPMILSADIQSGDRIVSAISPASFAGIACAIVPWLLAGGTLALLPDSDDLTAPGDARIHLIASAGAVLPLYHSLKAPLASIAAVHFSEAHFGTDFTGIAAQRVVDVHAIGELAVVPAKRNPSSLSAEPIPLGALQSGMPNGMPILETRLDEGGALAVRGAMVPCERIGAGGWIESGFSASRASTHSLLPRAPRGMIAIGALRFSFADLERRIMAAALVTSVSVTYDPVLGHRLSIESDRPEVTSRALIDAGLPRVIANAVRKSDAQKARA